ncbi:MAG: FAD-dependent oxidoreductase, partial [Chthoniobacterales bacterium]
GLADVPFFTNETIFDELKERPKSLLVLGGGPIGCELGQALARLGVRITIVQAGKQLLPPEDVDVADFMQKRFANEGIEVRLQAKVIGARLRGRNVVLELADGDSISADALLIAAGRTPNLSALDLGKAGVAHDKHGVTTNDYLQTSQPHIYAAGDITNRLKFTHTADATARVVVRNILMPLQFLRQKMDFRVVPWCTYTDPEVAHVGLGEKAAKSQNVDYDLFTVPVEELDRAVLESEEAGFVKVLTKKGSDEILGVTLVSAHAGDLLHEFVLAMKQGIGLGAIAATIHAYPTFAELARKAGDKYSKTRLTPTTKKLFHWLYERARQ